MARLREARDSQGHLAVVVHHCGGIPLYGSVVLWSMADRQNLESCDGRIIVVQRVKVVSRPSFLSAPAVIVSAAVHSVMQIRTTTVLCAHARRGGEEGSAMTMGRKYCAIDAAIALSLPLCPSLSFFFCRRADRERGTAFGSLFICERRDRPHDGNFAQRYYYY